MRRRPQPTRRSDSGRGDAACPGLRAFLLWISVVAALMIFGYAAQAQAQSGVITTVVGPGLRGSASGDSLSLPTGVAVSGSGPGATIYTADASNCVVWQTQNDQTSIFAGILATTPGTCGYAPPQSSPTETFLPYPVSLAACNGNLFIATHGIDPLIPQFTGQTATAGTVDEVNSSGTLSALPLPGGPYGPLYPVALACDGSGNVYVSSVTAIADGGVAAVVDEFSPATGGAWTTTALLSPSPEIDIAYTALAVDPTSGNLFGILAGQVGNDWLGTPDMAGGDKIINITTGAEAVSANNSFFDASGLAINGSGDFLISTAKLPDDYSSLVELVTPDGTITVLAGTGTAGYSGDGGLGTNAQVDGVDQLVLDSAGYLYMADSENQRIRRIHPLVPGPTALTLSEFYGSQSSTPQFGSLQGVLNPTTGDFYFVSGANTVNVVNTGSYYICPGCERVFASIPVGLNNGSSTSALTLAVDPTRNLVYVSSSADGNLYVINDNPGQTSSYTSVGAAGLGYQALNLLAVDPTLNEVYAAGPTSTAIVAISGGVAPQVLSTYTGLDAPIQSLSVDTATHTAYAMGVLQEGYGTDYPLLYTITPGTGGTLTVNTTQIAAVGSALPTGSFLTNSIASDPQSGSLLVSGGGYYNSSVDDYVAFDIFTFSPAMSEAPLPYSWQPFTTSLDVPNRAFYITDFNGNINDNNSNAVMVTGMDSVSVSDNTLSSTAIPAFGGTVSSPQTASSPHIYDVEPDTSSYQAWISASDATSGGFIALWDSSTQAVTLSVPFSSVLTLGGQPVIAPEGGNLVVDSANQAAYLLDQVNNNLWLINKPQWTGWAAPILTQQGSTLYISPNTSITEYTTDGTPPGLSATTQTCPSSPASCTVSLNTTPGTFTTVSAIFQDPTSGQASNVVQGVFTVPSPTSLALAVTPSPATTGASITATATLTTNSSTVTGTVNITVNGTAPSGCSGISPVLTAGTWQAVCTFTEDVAGTYTIGATFSGDTFNGTSTSNTVSLTVNQGTTPILGTVSGTTAPIVINANNESGQTTNAVLNSDSSVTLLQNGTVTGGCQAFSSLTGSEAYEGAIFLDGANSTVYLALTYGNTLYAGYETLTSTAGQCTQGQLVQLALDPNQDVEMNVDVKQGDIYIVNSFGVNFDKLYVLPTAPWNSTPTPSTETLDYSVTYGPIVIDPTGDHLVYINDLGDSTSGSAGTYTTNGFFVYDPVLAELAQVQGYVNSGGTQTPFYASTLLDNGAGELVLVNENPDWTVAGDNDAAPLTVLNTTQFSFFNNTQPGTETPASVYIEPGAALSTISATATYAAISAADINTANQLIYAYAFNENNASLPGMLLEYNLAVNASPIETVLSSSIAMPTMYDYEGPWSRLNYDSESTEIALSANAAGSGALGITSPLSCSGSLSLTNLVGKQGTPTALDYPVVNTSSGYLYAIQPNTGYPPLPLEIYFVAPPPPGCGASTPQPAVISVVSGSGQSAAIGTTFPNQLVVEVTDANNNPLSGVTVTFTAPSSGASAAVSSFTPMTGSDGTASVTAAANGIASSTAYQVSASVAGVSTPAVFSLTNTPAATTLTVTPSVTSLVYGQPVTINAAVSPSNVLGTVPTGSVTFYDGASLLTPNSTVSSAAASYTVSVPAVGTHTYAAQYLGDANFQASTMTAATSLVMVGMAASTLAGPSQTLTLQQGQTGSIAITVTGQYLGSGIAAPTGSISWTVSGNGFAAGTAPISNGSAAIPVPNTVAAGSYTVTVSYAGDSNYNAATAIAVTLTVTAAVQAAVVTDNETITVSDADQVLLSALSSDNEAISVIDAVSVQVSAMVTDNETITVSDAGIDVLPGDLSGDNEAISVADTVLVQVLGIHTTTTLAISPSLVSTGQSVTFVATVTQDVEAGAPTGAVTFSCAQPSLNSGPIALSAGSASWTTSSLPAGIYNNCITAAYSGDASHAPSASPPGSLTVINIQYEVPPPADVVLWPGQSTSFTFTLAPASITFNGTVGFSMNGLPPNVTATFNPQAVTLGSNPVTVTVTLTAAALAAAGQPEQRPGSAAPLLLALLLPLLGLRSVRRRLRRGGWLALAVLLSLIAVSGLTACVGGGGFFNQPPQTYTVTLTATSGTAQQSVTFNVSVE